MSVAYLKYALSGGWIQNWLVAGPLAIAADDDALAESAEARLEIARRYYEPDSGIAERPAERATFTSGDGEQSWRYHRCWDDHYVDLTGFYHTAHYLRSWAYAELVCPVDVEGTFVLTTNGPADLWVNGEHVHRQEHVSQQQPASASCRAAMHAGQNSILVRFEAGAVRACPYVMALHVGGLPPSTGSLSRQQKALWTGREPFQPVTGEAVDVLPDEAQIYLPTTTRYPVRQQMLEHIFEHVRVDHYVHNRGNEVTVRWGRDLDHTSHYETHIQDARNRVYVEALGEAEAGATIDVGHPARIWEGRYEVVIRPRGVEWYELKARHERRFPIYILDHDYSVAPYGTYEQRRTEALEHAARHERNVYTQIARMALGRWPEVDVQQVLATLGAINRREDCSDSSLIGLLGAIYRYGGDPDFPAELTQSLEECVLGFKYWRDEPGSDAMCYDTEHHSILFHACEILAGQLYPDHTFTNVGQTGRWHREKGERLALQWLYERATTGFTEWDSNCSYEEDLLALAHLLGLAESQEVHEMAVVLIDNMLFTMAVNSFKGAFGSSHGRTYAPMIRSAQLEATSGIGRLMWGMGVWNQHIRGLVGLACSEYEPAPIFADIAADPSPEMWNRENQAGVSKVTYRTPDYMLCSAQDYRPGQAGYQQHIWQATLGPDAVVFVNHPACVSEAGSHRPSFWHGNQVLPRVAQWKETLVAIHRIPEGDWMGFTHAYFPTRHFDEYRLRHGWAFARKGRGYLALTAARGLELVTRGPSAYFELRSYGAENLWLCTLGRPDTDGSFEAFQEAVLGLDVQMEGSTIRCQTTRGQTIAFGWEGPFLVDEVEQPLSGFKHYENPFCTVDLPADEIEIRTADYLLRLDFAPRPLDETS
jgi:hypothetical protein